MTESYSNKEEQNHSLLENVKLSVINNEKVANEIINMIIIDKSAAIGLDIEAAVEMSRFGILCLLQVKNKIKSRYLTIMMFTSSILLRWITRILN